MHARRLLYFIVDGAHVRFVERSHETGDYVTVRRIDGAPQLEQVRAQQRGAASGRSFESVGGARHTVGPEDAYRRAKTAFAASAVEALNGLLAHGHWEGVVLAAPSRLIPVLRSHLGAHTPVTKTIARNLIKTPDHELGAWLTTV